MNAPHLPELPHSIETEQSVLGALLLDAAAWASTADLVSAADFFGLPANRTVELGSRIEV